MCIVYIYNYALLYIYMCVCVTICIYTYLDICKYMQGNSSNWMGHFLIVHYWTDRAFLINMRHLSHQVRPH